MVIDSRKLSKYIKDEFNVLLIGKHGVGKTSAVEEAVKEAGVKCLYMSGSTMDPFLDFIGIPVRDSENDTIKMIRPENIPSDIEMIFIDEYNRSHQRVRNAVMELIQFKTINRNVYFPNLKCVWAAINPDDDNDTTYDVDELDPAQQDRFHIHINVPFEVDEKYFIRKYGNIGEAAVEWWKSIPKKSRHIVSPRRLDYALMVWQKNGDVRDVIDEKARPAGLISMLSQGPLKQTIEQAYVTNDKNLAKKILTEPNAEAIAWPEIRKKNNYIQFFAQFLPKDKFNSFINEDINLRLAVKEHLKEYGRDSHFYDMINEMTKSKGNSKSSEYLKKLLDEANKKQWIQPKREELESIF